MFDDTPYIIVDDRKIRPIQRGFGTHLVRAESSIQADPPFGVVDRVSISRAALDKCRQACNTGQMDPPSGSAPLEHFPSLPPLLLSDMSQRQR